MKKNKSGTFLRVSNRVPIPYDVMKNKPGTIFEGKINPAPF